LPAVPASAHVNAGGYPPVSRRTRIEPTHASGASGALAVAFPDGRTVALDRTVYVGRSPKSPRITSGVVPELVAVPSPRREVSSTHVEIQQEGRAVVVRDLGSTNGTRVRVPGAAPSMLSPGASRVVATGTLLDLGDDVVLEIVERPGVVPTEGASW
jgi:pSer/pThr/pTyr-binding forkhead associated (FHA) protein